MKSLCADNYQHAHLAKLIDFIINNTLDPGEAWSAFSSPKEEKVFKRKNKPTKRIKFSPAEVNTYKLLRTKVQKKLFELSVGSCAYCRRPVGHYGWAWHIEHVLAKSKHPSLTFDLSNLTVGCVHCNQWKGARIDRKLSSKKLPIINPLAPGFIYSNHITYVQISTESVCFAKYSTHSDEGRETYKSLEFKELERAYAINGMHALTAALHDRLNRLMYVELTNSEGEGEELLKLLGSLKTSIYEIP